MSNQQYTRAEATTFIMLISLIVLVVIILIGVLGYQKTASVADDTHMLMLVSNIEKDIAILKASRGTKMISYDLPQNVDYVLLIDHSFKETLLQDEFILNNSFVYDTIESGATEDMFLFSKTGRLIKAYDIGTVSIQQVNNDVCTGKAIFKTRAQKIEMTMSHTGNGEIVIGDECATIGFITLQGPFNESHVRFPTTTPQVEISYDARQFRLKRDITATSQGRPLFYQNYTFFVDNIALNKSVYPYRIYYSGDELQDSKILLRLGFKEGETGDYIYYGPDTSVNQEDKKGYYYEYKGQFISFPNQQFNNVSIMITLQSDTQRLYSPSLRVVQVGYRKKTTA